MFGLNNDAKYDLEVYAKYSPILIGAFAKKKKH